MYTSIQFAAFNIGAQFNIEAQGEYFSDNTCIIIAKILLYVDFTEQI